MAILSWCQCIISAGVYLDISRWSVSRKNVRFCSLHCSCSRHSPENDKHNVRVLYDMETVLDGLISDKTYVRYRLVGDGQVMWLRTADEPFTDSNDDEYFRRIDVFPVGDPVSQTSITRPVLCTNDDLEPHLLTWINFNHSMGKYLHPLQSAGWNFLSLPNAAVEVWEWISDLITHFTGHVITYPCTDQSSSMLVKGPLLVKQWYAFCITGPLWGESIGCYPRVGQTMGH